MLPSSPMEAAWLLCPSPLLSPPNSSVTLVLIYYMSASDESKREQSLWMRDWQLQDEDCAHLL